MKILKTILKLPNRFLNSLLDEYSLSREEFRGYFAILSLSIPIYLYFLLKIFESNIPLIIINILGLYTVGCGIYSFIISYKNLKEKLILSLLLVISYVYFEKWSFNYDKAFAYAFVITVLYFLVIYLIINNRYYNMFTCKENPAGLTMFAKKYALIKFKSEYVASCLKINETATRKSIKNDLNLLYESIKKELSQYQIDKSIAEYSEEKIKLSKNEEDYVNKTGNYKKGFITIDNGIRMPIYEINDGIPVIYIRGLDNHITNTTEFARRCKVGTDINGQKFIYPTTPYLNQYELALFTDVDNIIIRFKEEKIKGMDRKQLSEHINAFDKVIDCYYDFHGRIKDTIDVISIERAETQIERSLRQDIEKMSDILGMYKLYFERKQEKETTDYEEDKYYKRRPADKSQNKNNTFTSDNGKGIPSVKSRQEVFAEGMDELENLIGLSRLKEEIKQLVDKHRIDRRARDVGLEPALFNNNFVLIGNYGTGKTTAAKIISKLLFGQGILKSWEIHEITASDLIGDNIEETQKKTRCIFNEVIQRGEMLLIKNLQQLCEQYNDKELGKYALKLIASLLKKYQDRFSCVVTCNADNIISTIKDFEPEIEIGFSSYIHFENYKPEELVKIFECTFCGFRYNLNHDSRLALKKGFIHLIDTYPDFANAHDARKIFEKAVKKQTSRLAGQTQEHSKQKLMQINEEDIDMAIQEFIREKNKMEAC